jgi:uncharacterized protein YjbI with pentapeptide repeats
MWPFAKPKPSPPGVIVRNVLGEQILEIPLRELAGSTCLRGKDLSHADLRGQSFWSADLEETILFGADVRGCDFSYCNLKNANLAYALLDGASFHRANLDGTDLLHTSIKLSRLDGAIITPESTIPGVKVVTR